MDSLHFAVKTPLLDNSKGVRHVNYTAMSSSVALSMHAHTHTHTELFCSFPEEQVKNFERKTQKTKTLR